MMNNSYVLFSNKITVHTSINMGETNLGASYDDDFLSFPSLHS